MPVAVRNEQYSRKLRSHFLLEKIKAVVFDLDNTLVSSDLDFALIRQQLGCGKELGILEFIEQLPVAQQQQATDKVIAHELSDAYSATVLEGCHELLQNIAKSTLKTAILTRNCRAAAEIKIRNNYIDIPLVLTREDYPAKPAPDALLYLSEHWQIAPQHILYVGDYLYDVQIAKNAKANSCLVTFGRSLDFAHMANITVKDLRELNQIISPYMVKEQ